jgi:hypothetical protein
VSIPLFVWVHEITSLVRTEVGQYTFLCIQRSLPKTIPSSDEVAFLNNISSAQEAEYRHGDLSEPLYS